MSEYYMPRLKTGKDEHKDGDKPYTFSQCLVEPQEGNLLNLVFIVGDKSLKVPISKGAARELLDRLQIELLPSESWGS